MKQQAQYIWNRLDDLASTDPNAYKKFIEEQMKERELFNSIPEPRICVLAKVQDGNPNQLFLNICGWKRIPYPSNDEEPLKLMSGFLHRQMSPGSSSYISLPVAVNDKVLDEMLKSSFDKLELIKLVMLFVSQQHKFNLEEKFEICKELYKGDLPANPRRLFDKHANTEFDEATLKELLHGGGETLSSPEDLLKKLSAEDADPNLIKNLTEPNKKKQLVEELNSDSAKNNATNPDYTLNDNNLGQLILNIKLPLVHSAAECDLNITSGSVELTVPSLYELTLSLPDRVDELKASAKFNKKSSVLTLKMPKLKPLS